MKTSNILRYQTQKGLGLSTFTSLALAKSHTTRIFCNKSWSAFPALPGLRAGGQRTPNQARLYPIYQAVICPIPISHHMRLDVAIPRGKQRHALFSMSKAQLETEKGDRNSKQLQVCHSPSRFPSSPWGVGCLQGEGKSLALYNSPQCLWWHKLWGTAIPKMSTSTWMWFSGISGDNVGVTIPIHPHSCPVLLLQLCWYSSVLLLHEPD